LRLVKVGVLLNSPSTTVLLPGFQSGFEQVGVHTSDGINEYDYVSIKSMNDPQVPEGDGLLLWLLPRGILLLWRKR